MSVGPIEVIRAQEATQIRHIDIQRAQHAEDQISRNFQNMVQHEHDKPTQTTKTENNEYRYDSKEKGNNQASSSGGKKREKQEKKELKDGKSTPVSRGFDVLI